MSAQEGNCKLRHHSLDVVGRLLDERTELLVLYNQLTGRPPFPEPEPLERRRLLRQFCQLLVDYLAAAHVHVYERVLTGRERRAGVRQAAASVYPRLAESTDAALAFSEEFCDGQADPERLDAALDDLGQHLATRVDLEDRIWQQICRASPFVH